MCLCRVSICLFASLCFRACICACVNSCYILQLCYNKSIDRIYRTGLQDHETVKLQSEVADTSDKYFGVVAVPEGCLGEGNTCSIIFLLNHILSYHDKKLFSTYNPCITLSTTAELAWWWKIIMHTNTHILSLRTYSS